MIHANFFWSIEFTLHICRTETSDSLQRECGNKRDFVPGAPSGLATGVFAAQVGIIGCKRLSNPPSKIF